MIINTKNIWLCKKCDLIIEKKQLTKGTAVYCPNCNYCIAIKSRLSILFSLIFSIIGLLLFFPACFFPLMKMQIFINTTSHSIFSGVWDFIQQGMWIPAILIIFSAIVTPFIYLFLSMLILICFWLKYQRPFLLNLIYWFNYFRIWGMLEVYLLGIFIAIFKLKTIAIIHPSLGLFFLIGLIVCQFLISCTIQPSMLWYELDEMSRKINEPG